MYTTNTKDKTFLTGMEIDSHAACIISNNNDVQEDNIGIDLHLSKLPTIASDCRLKDNKFNSFVNQMQQSITIGCAVCVLFL